MGTVSLSALGKIQVFLTEEQIQTIVDGLGEASEGRREAAKYANSDTESYEGHKHLEKKYNQLSDHMRSLLYPVKEEEVKL